MNNQKEKPWTWKCEVDFIRRLGTLDEKLRGDPNHTRQCLEGYIKGAHLKDWERAGIDMTRCILAAEHRLRMLK